MKTFVTLFTFFIVNSCFASDSLYTIKLNFLYGSKPAKGFKKTEPRLFGGIKGGHVNIEAGGKVLDFLPGNNPLFPNNKRPSGGFRLSQASYKHPDTDKWSTVVIPVSSDQYFSLQKLFDSLTNNTPYDYSIFGMRCAAASYDVLSKIGLFKEISNTKNVAKHFYPKLLRKKILKWADQNNYSIINHEGKPSRKWESDKGLF